MGSDDMKRYVHHTNYNTFVIDNRQFYDYVQSAHLYVTDREERERMVDDVFEILNTAYDEIGGFKSFKDMQHFIDDSYLWYITYDGQVPTNADLDINKILTVSVFRQKCGLKMVGMATNRFPYFSSGSEERRNAKMKAKSALSEHIRFVASHGWAEISGRLESEFARSLPWGKYVIMPEVLIDNKVFKDISIDVDGVHYYRPLRRGEEPIRKIAYGVIKI